MPNPFLPLDEFIPDGEPHIFNGRVYIYGSHDTYDDRIFCTGNYVSYSADINDLTNRKYEGVIYDKKKDPKTKSGRKNLFAPDIIQAKDGKYYLFYGIEFTGLMGVAKSDSPTGPFEFYGHVKHKNGKLIGREHGDYMPFDPAVILDNGKYYLFYGFYTPIPFLLTGFVQNKNLGGVICELEDDLLTLKSEPKLLFPKDDPKCEGHPFFEASSIRKFKDKYYFIYSSKVNHDLCYMISSKIDGPYEYKGVLIDIGDIGLFGIKEEKDANNYLGNTHGGMFNVGCDYYQIYHRHTNRHGYSRQACVERFEMNEDGTFNQHEITSLGFEKVPFCRPGIYFSSIACIIKSKDGVGRYDTFLAKQKFKKHPAFVLNKDRKPYISGIRNRAQIGYRYFDFSALHKIKLSLKGKASGFINVYLNKELFYKLPVDINNKEYNFTSEILVNKKPDIDLSKTELVFEFDIKGILDFDKFYLE